MRQRLFSLRLKNLGRQRNLLLIVSAGLVISNLILCLGLVNKKETTILVPPEITHGLTFTSNHPSASYLQEMSLFFSSLVLDNSEKSFDYKKDVILRYVSPQFFGDLKRKLIETQERYKNENLCTHFRPVEVVINGLQASVTGELETFVGGTRVSETKETFVITYDYKGGFLSITSFKSEGSDSDKVALDRDAS